MNKQKQQAIKAADRAIKAVGGVQKLADKLGEHQTLISAWKARGVPARRVLDVESATGVSRHELRPDIYGEMRA